MALKRHQIHTLGVSPYAHEQEAIELIKRALPSQPPYALWALVDFFPGDGRNYEIDAIVLGYHQLFVVEIKSWPGTITADDPRDWRIRFPDGHTVIRESPLRLTTLKAKVLAGQIDHQLRHTGVKRPWVEPLVFLADENVHNHLRGTAAEKVVTRDTFVRAITHSDYPGARPLTPGQRVDTPTARAVVLALESLGIKKSEGRLRLGSWKLGDVIADGPGWQDRLAVHEATGQLGRRRVRTYLVPQAESDQRKEQLRRAALREMGTLSILGDHPHVLRVHDYQTDGPLGGPCIVFEHVEATPGADLAEPDDGSTGAPTLDTFLRQNPDLSFGDRLEIIAQIGEALAYCHNKSVLHRGLDPTSVLVARAPDDELATRLLNFQLSVSEHTTSPATIHISAFTRGPAEVYRAPELYENPDAASTASDVFSLGALAWLVLVGRPPAQSIAERHTMLQRDGGLSVAAASDELVGVSPEQTRSLDDVIRGATALRPIDRYDDAHAWVELLLEAATQPATPDAEPEVGVDPLSARPGDILTAVTPAGERADLLVEAVLGVGATSRVLRVDRDGRSLALKVALNPDAAIRLDAEADLLGRLRSDRVAALVDRCVLRSGNKESPSGASRDGLLVEDAGRTLADLLRVDGPPTLDYAARWGTDLLRALQTLEELGLTHRDIKPANLGVQERRQKTARHLLLFDFSLAGLPADQIGAGTPVYRDPFLPARGRWDGAADRWSAAMTLHELMAGVRPEWDELPAIASTAPIAIAAERFDAAARDRLVGFFERALHRDVAERFDSAESMGQAWAACFAEQPVVAPPTRPGEGDLAGVHPDTPVEALPLSVRAKNALDRAGVWDAAGLLDLPRNQLSVIRGIGRRTQTEIIDLIDRLAAHLSDELADTGEARPPFRADYRGPDADVDFSGLPGPVKRALRDAGLGTVGLVVTAPRERVEHVLHDKPGGVEAVAAWIDGVEAGAAAAEAPATLDGWLEALAPPASGRGTAHLRYARWLLGLDAIGGRLVSTPAALAEAADVSTQAVYLHLQRAREAWLGHPGLGVLREAAVAALDDVGGIAPIERAAEALAALIPPAAGQAPDDAALRSAAALLRIAAETGEGLEVGEVGYGLWLGRDVAHLEAARRLRDAADELAEREPLPSSEVVRERLLAEVEGTPLTAAPPALLATRAAEASVNAALSARLELYPIEMAAERALRLSAGALGGAVSPRRVGEIVHARYPEAKRVPGRPLLDGLMKELGMPWHEGDSVYRRPRPVGPTVSPTEVASRRPTTHVSHRPPATAQEQEALETERALRLAIERRDFRVLEVNAAHAERAAAELTRLGLDARSLDALLLEAIERRMAAANVSAEAVEAADREGPGGEHWPLLGRLVQDAATELADELAAETGVLVLTHPGLLARYGLDDFVARLIEAARADTGPGILMLIPTVEQMGTAAIDGRPKPLVIPTTTAAQRVRLTESWVNNDHRAAAG